MSCQRWPTPSSLMHSGASAPRDQQQLCILQEIAIFSRSMCTHKYDTSFRVIEKLKPHYSPPFIYFKYIYFCISFLFFFVSGFFALLAKVKVIENQGVFKAITKFIFTILSESLKNLALFHWEKVADFSEEVIKVINVLLLHIYASREYAVWNKVWFIIIIYKYCKYCRL